MKNIFYLIVVLSTACSTTSPSIKSAPTDDVQLKQVVLDVDNSIGKPVRWGGKVIKVNNDDNFSTIQMVQFPLNSFGKPVTTKTSQGRFVSQSPAFLDPVIFEEGTLVTFFGTVRSAEMIKVDQRSLLMPIVDINEFHIWPERNKDLAHSHYYLSPYHGRFVGYGYYGTGRYYPYQYKR